MKFSHLAFVLGVGFLGGLTARNISKQQTGLVGAAVGVGGAIAAGWLATKAVK